MFPVQTMKVAAALHTVKRHSRLGCVLTELRPDKKFIERSDLQARRAHLSGSWNREQGGTVVLVQTMRLAAALHTVRRHPRPGRLQVGLRAVRDASGEEGPVGLESAPVRWLVCMSRTLEFPSAAHEGGNGPAHHKAAFATRVLACRDESFWIRWQRKAACRFGGRTCQIVGMQGEEGQRTEQVPRGWQLPCTPSGNIEAERRAV